VYERVEGRWRDLLNRLKWDTVKSAVKSVAGLQGRKFKARTGSLMVRRDDVLGGKPHA
jgi:hypothetical protein